MGNCLLVLVLVPRCRRFKKFPFWNFFFFIALNCFYIIGKSDLKEIFAKNNSKLIVPRDFYCWMGKNDASPEDVDKENQGTVSAKQNFVKWNPLSFFFFSFLVPTRGLSSIFTVPLHRTEKLYCKSFSEGKEKNIAVKLLNFRTRSLSIL